MASLLSTAKKDEINSVLTELQDTFKKEIFIYTKDSGEDILEESDYNFIYNNGPNTPKSSNDKPFIKESAYARVFYINEQKEVNDQFGAEMNLSVSQGIVRLKVDKETHEKILTASKVEVDDVLYGLISDPKNIGPFGSQYYQIYLRREN